MQPPLLTDSLRSAYLDAQYRILIEPPIVLCVGLFSAEVSHLLHRHGARGGVLISACNPFSRPLEHEENGQGVLMDWYNGFSAAEREANGEALRKGLNAGTVEKPTCPCTLCGDPNAALEYHSEDYAKPYRWTQPAAYAVCRSCHRNKLHKRFANCKMWHTFMAHVRRGGYASDLAKPEVKRELAAYELFLDNGTPMALEQLRPYQAKAGEEWWAKLTTDPASLRAEWARPKRQ